MTMISPPRSMPPRTSAPPQQQAGQPMKIMTSLKFGKPNVAFEPPRIVLHAVEGFGKTTIGAYAPSPIILMAQGETGYATLRSANRVPEVDTLVDDDNRPRAIQSWNELLETVDTLIANETGHKTLVLDAMGGFERLCHEHVCKTQFNGDWGERGFGAFQKGYDLSVTEWLKLLSSIDRLRSVRGATIILLAHTAITTFKNPQGADFDRYVAKVHPKTWSVTHGWADAVLFGNFLTVVDKAKTTSVKGKGIGGTDRVVYTERRDAFDAKNRYGMLESIDLSNDPSAGWGIIWSAIKGA